MQTHATRPVQRRVEAKEYAIFALLGAMLGVTAVDMSVGTQSTIGEALWWLIARL